MKDAGGADLAELLRAHRVLRGFTQEELAERAGISTRAVSDMERGLRRIIYKDTALRLAVALSLPDAEQQVFHAAARGRMPAEAAAEPLPTDIPVPPTRLIGREDELANLTNLLSVSGARLVTLTGPGGIGKTRLAIEAARTIASSFGAVFYIPLGDIRDPDLVVPAIAGALRVRESTGSLLAALGSHLRSKRALLLLDTFEHLLPAAPAVGEILGQAPSLTVLATSRAPLNLRGEFQVAVEPLKSGATTLFAERAVAAKSDFRLDDGTVTEICDHLEGLPLAIELAAARARHLSLAEILSHLQHRVPILTGGPVDLPARQRAMADTVAWSYDLLGSEERQLLERLSVFSGTSSFESVKAVCAPDSTKGEVIDRLSRLVDSSIVLREGADGTPRHRLLDVVRQYAAGRLLNRVHEEGVSQLRQQHAEHFLQLAESAEPHLRTADQSAWISRLTADRDNLRAALSWAIERSRADIALRLTGALWMFWRPAGAFSEGRAWFDQALRLNATGHETFRTKALWGAGWLAYQQGDYTTATGLGEELLAWAQQAGRPEDVRNGVTLVGMGRLAARNYDEASRLFQEALDIARSHASPWLLATSLLNRSVAALHAGDLDRARSLMAESQAIFDQLGDDRFSARVSLQLAYLALLEDEVGTAADLMMTSLAMFSDLSDTWGIAEQLGGLSAMNAAAGDWRRAATLAGAAQSVWESMAACAHPADAASNERWSSAARVQALATEWNEAYAEGRAMDSASAVAFALQQ